MLAFGFHSHKHLHLRQVPVPVVEPDELTLAMARTAELRVQIECMQERIRIMQSRMPRMLERLRETEADDHRHAGTYPAANQRF